MNKSLFYGNTAPELEPWFDFARQGNDKLSGIPMMHVKIPVKIVCRCGQRYIFDVIPVDGCVPSPVACPACGTDGTAVANEIIALTLGARPARLMFDAQSPAGSPTTETGHAKMELDMTTWRRRALEAEQRADQAQAAARASLMPYLAQMLKETVVQELALQRRELLEAQTQAALEIASMIRRLDTVEGSTQERLRAYEARIQELEKELSALNEENRELLKLKIEMIRRQLEIERVHDRLQFIPN